MAEDFEPRVIDLITLAFQSHRPDLVRTAALVVARAPRDSSISTNVLKLMRVLDTSVRTWVATSKPAFLPFAEMVAPLVETGLAEEGWNVFDPVALAGRLRAKAPQFFRSPMIPDGKAFLDIQQIYVPVALGTIFSADVIDVIDKQLQISEAKDVEPGLLCALACRPDVPLPCFLPTAHAIVEVVRRSLAHEVSLKCGLKVPLDLSGIPVPPAERCRPMHAPRGTEVPS